MVDRNEGRAPRGEGVGDGGVDRIGQRQVEHRGHRRSELKRHVPGEHPRAEEDDERDDEISSRFTISTGDRTTIAV